MSDRRPYSILQLRDLGHGIHDLPDLDTIAFRSYAVRLDPHEHGLPIDRYARTLILVAEGSLTIVWCDETRVPIELGEGGAASTNPPAVEVLTAGAEGATFLAMLSRV